MLRFDDILKAIAWGFIETILLCMIINVVNYYYIFWLLFTIFMIFIIKKHKLKEIKRKAKEQIIFEKYYDEEKNKQ